MPPTTDFSEYGIADDLLGKQCRQPSWKSWLRDVPLPWLLALNSTPILFTYVLLTLWLLLTAVTFISDAMVDGMVPHVQALVLGVLGASISLVASVVRASRQTPLFGEFVFIGVVAILELSLWLGVVFVNDFGLRQRSLCLLTALLNTIPGLLDMRLLPNILMSVWVCVGNVVATCLSNYVHGDDFSMSQFYVIALCGFTYFWQARVHQFRLCCLYDVQKQGLEHISTMETVLAMLSDGTALLASDGDTVCKCDSRLSANLGISWDAVRLSDALFDKNEVECFAEQIKHVREGPALLKTRLKCRDETERRVHVEVLIVNVERTLQASYLACFRRVSQGQPTDQNGAIKPSKIPAALSDQQDILSVPETSITGQLFEAIQLAAAKEQWNFPLIDQVAHLGVSEHWLLHESEIDLKPDVILGTGGFGSVLEADYLGLRVAVKVPKLSTDGKSKLAVMLNELRVLRCVRHPNIVLFFGAYIKISEYEVGLVFERIDGESLDRCVESLSQPTTKLGIALNICCALRYLHSQTPVIVHGDIKTPNILVEGRGDSIRAKLADFGLSRLVSKTTKVLGGSLRWLPPEVIRASRKNGLGRPTLSADVFSFGRVLFCIMFGTNKCCEDASPATIKDMACLNIVMPFLQFPLDLPLSAETNAICELCILADPQKRPTTHTVHSELVSWFDKLRDPSQKWSL